MKQTGKLDDIQLEKLAQYWAKKMNTYNNTKIGYIRAIINDAYNLGIKDCADLLWHDNCNINENI